MATAIRVNVQIILENSLETHFKAVEIVDEFTDSCSEYLLKFVCDALDDIPVISPDLTIPSKIPLEDIPGVKVEDITLTHQSKILLIIGTKLLQRPNLKQLLTSLQKNGFVLTREELSSAPELDENLEIVTEYTTSNEKLILLKKNENFVETTFIPVCSNDLNWLPEVQKSLKDGSNIVVYSVDEQPEGVLGLVNCIRREPNGHKLKCFFLMDEAPKFDPNSEFYQDQVRKNLAVNIYKNKNWGTYRHLRLEQTPEVECQYCYANVMNIGDISSFKWLEGTLREETPLPKDKILIKVGNPSSLETSMSIFCRLIIQRSISKTLWQP